MSNDTYDDDEKCPECGGVVWVTSVCGDGEMRWECLFCEAGGFFWDDEDDDDE